MSALVAKSTVGKIRMPAGRANGVQAHAASATELGARRVLCPATRAVHRRDDTSVERPVRDKGPVERSLLPLIQPHLTQWCLRREPQNDEIAERRSDPFANSPRSYMAPLCRPPARRRATVSYPTVHDHPHARHGRERPREALVEPRVVWAHDDEHLGIGKRSRGQGLEQLGLVAPADAVRR